MINKNYHYLQFFTRVQQFFMLQTVFTSVKLHENLKQQQQTKPETKNTAVKEGRNDWPIYQVENWGSERVSQLQSHTTGKKKKGGVQPLAFPYLIQCSFLWKSNGWWSGLKVLIRGGRLQGEKYILDGWGEGSSGVRKGDEGHEVLLALVGKPV